MLRKTLYRGKFYDIFLRHYTGVLIAKFHYLSKEAASQKEVEELFWMTKKCLEEVEAENDSAIFKDYIDFGIYKAFLKSKSYIEFRIINFLKNKLFSAKKTPYRLYIHILGLKLSFKQKQKTCQK